ncbi:MAG: hypothetical protein WDM79_18985 [Terricaulis sp.]
MSVQPPAIAARNLLSLAPPSLGDMDQPEFIDIVARAGFDAVGLRVEPTPGRPSAPVLGNPALVRAIKQRLDDTA